MDFTEASLIFKLLNRNHLNDFPPSQIDMHLLLWGINCGDSTGKKENTSISSTSHFALNLIPDFIWSQFHITIGRTTIEKEEAFQVEVGSLWGERGTFYQNMEYRAEQQQAWGWAIALFFPVELLDKEIQSRINRLIDEITVVESLIKQFCPCYIGILRYCKYYNL